MHSLLRKLKMTKIAEPDKGIRRYRVVVERILGKSLPAGAVVHHWDGDRTNNIPSNLAVFPDEPYHNLIHLRMEAYKACGNANYLKCYVCKKHDAPEKLTAVKKAGRRVTTFYHPECRNAYRRAAYQERVK